MFQLSFGDMEYSNRRRKTKRELFLEQMDKIIPWADWVDMIAAYFILQANADARLLA